MGRILVSWIGTLNDFNGNEPSKNGPTYRFHQYFYKGYDKHILLSSENENNEYSKARLLFSLLASDFSQDNFELRFMNLPEAAVVNFNIIHPLVYSMLLEYQKTEIDIFISPGTPTMQVVWYFIHLESDFKTRLLQTLKPNDTSTGKPELIKIELQKSLQMGYLLQKQINLNISKTDPERVSKVVAQVYDTAFEIAQAPKTTVLIEGETGTGKEVMARFIYQNSPRNQKPFVTVNCAAISPELLESRLFGHEKGAFTSAIKTSQGYFHEADGGTIFLDEIGDINSSMQIALLRVIQEGEIQRVGNSKQEKVDVRIIAATNKSLYEECKKGNFRWDLYYRLNVAEIILPPLRERGKEYIKLLLEQVSTEIQAKYFPNRAQLKFSKEAIETLLVHSWPGNVRELQNLVEKLYAYGLKDIDNTELPISQFQEKSQSLILDDVIKGHINKVVTLCEGNVTRAKKLLGIGSVNTIKKYMS